MLNESRDEEKVAIVFILWRCLVELDQRKLFFTLRGNVLLQYQEDEGFAVHTWLYSLKYGAENVTIRKNGRLLRRKSLFGPS